MVSLAILWPRRWELAADLGELLHYIETEGPHPLDELYRELSVGMQSSRVENWKGLGLLSILLQIASGLLVVEVILWIIAIASTG